MFTYASFFQEIKSQQRTAFNIAPSVVDNEKSIGKTLDFNSVFMEAKDDFSFIIDLSQFNGMVFQEKPLLTCLRNQFPKAIGIRDRMIGKNHKIMEINFPSEEDCLEALNKKFVLQDQVIQVNKALDKNANVIRVGVAELPYKTAEVLKPLMIKTFDILNLGLNYSKKWSLVHWSLDLLLSIKTN